MKKEAGTTNPPVLNGGSTRWAVEDAGRCKKRLRDLIRAHRGLEAEPVGLDARFVEDLGFDSLNGLGLVDALEERLHISVADRAVLEISTVGDAVRALEAARR